MANYPSSDPTIDSLHTAVNNLSTGLDGAIDDSQTTITVTDTTNFPSVGAITIDAERISYTSKNATQFLGCTRGFGSTTPVSHVDASTVKQTYGAEYHNDLRDEVIAIASDLRDKLGSTLARNLAPTGSLGAPSYAFVDDPDTGIANINAGQMYFISNGTSKFAITANGPTVTSGTLGIPDGAVGTPSLRFNNDAGTGIYSPGASQLGLAVGGNDLLTFTASVARFHQNIYAVNGTNSLPSIAFYNDPDTGMYRAATNTIGFATSGTAQWRINSSGSLSVEATNTNGIIRVGQGSSSSPAITNATDSNTGFFWSGNNDVIYWSGGGTQGGYLTSLGIQVVAGSAATPSYSFAAAGDTDTGMYLSASNAVGFSANSELQGQFVYSSAGVGYLQLPNNHYFSAPTSNTASNPPYSFTGDPDTGMFLYGTNILGFATNGLTQWRIGATGALAIDSTDNTGGVVLSGTGSESAPSYSFNFTGATGMGMYRVASTQLGFSIGGVQHFQIEGTGSLSAGEVSIKVYDKNTSSLVNVTVGAADSGGTGYKVLRIPN